MKHLTQGWRLGVAVASCWVAALIAAPAWAQYSITWWTVDGGGTSVTGGGGYLVAGTIGQPDAGTMSGGVYTLSGGFWRGGQPTVGVDDDVEDAGTNGEIPIAFALHGAVPNPVVRGARVAFDLPASRDVRMRVYDTNGRVVRTLVEGSLKAGRHQHAWDGVDDRGLPLAAGIYFLRLDTDRERATRKVTVLR